MTPEQQNDEDLDRIMQAARDLSEFFDSVQIFATRSDSDKGTVFWDYGLGNWFARRGQVGEWILKEDQAARLSVKPNDQP